MNQQIIYWRKKVVLDKITVLNRLQHNQQIPTDGPTDEPTDCILAKKGNFI